MRAMNFRSPRSREIAEISIASARPSPRDRWRELSEAAFAVGQAWMRLPLALSSCAPPAELQAAVTRLTEAQGRAYKLWMEAIQKMGEMAKPGSGPR